MNEEKNINEPLNPAFLVGAVSGSGLLPNCTRKEALTHFGFTYVGRVSIRGNKYSKCLFNDKLKVYAVPFMWRTSFHRFMSRDENIQKAIDQSASDMWYGVDVINYFKILSERLGVIA